MSIITRTAHGIEYLSPNNKMADLAKILACSSCRQSFNDSTRQPLSLLCGHVACRACVSAVSMFACTRDDITESRKIDQIPVADLIMQLMKSADTPLTYTCRTHSKVFEFFCSDCRSLFCSKCVMAHQRHDYTDIDSASPIVHKIKSDCFEAISLAETNLRETVKRLKKIEDAHTLHEAQISKAIEDLRNDYIKRRNDLNAKLYEECGRVKREFIPLTEYLDKHEEHQLACLSDKQTILKHAAAVRQELDKSNSNTAVLVQLELFSFKPQLMEAFEFNASLFRVGNVNHKKEVSIEEVRWSEMFHRKSR